MHLDDAPPDLPQMPSADPSGASLRMPHALEAEREVLAAVLIDQNVMDTLSEKLRAEDFYLERHQLLFRKSYVHQAGRKSLGHRFRKLASGVIDAQFSKTGQ